MLKKSKLGDIFWGKVVHTIVHILNTGLLRSNTDKTPYQLQKGRVTNAKHFKVFGSKCYIKRDDNIGKLYSWVDKGILVGYSRTRKKYKCYNLRIKKIVESINTKVDEASLQKNKKESRNSNILEESEVKELMIDEEEEEEREVQQEEKIPYTKEKKDNQKKLDTLEDTFQDT